MDVNRKIIAFGADALKTRRCLLFLIISVKHIDSSKFVFLKTDKEKGGNYYQKRILNISLFTQWYGIYLKHLPLFKTPPLSKQNLTRILLVYLINLTFFAITMHRWDKPTINHPIWLSHQPYTNYNFKISLLQMKSYSSVW